MEHELKQRDMDLYIELAYKTLAKLRGINYSLCKAEYSSDFSSEEISAGFDLQDIAETLGL